MFGGVEMSLQFIIGRAGTGKTTLIMDKLEERMNSTTEKQSCIFFSSRPNDITNGNSIFGA